MNEILDHLNVQVNKDSVSVGVKVGNVHEPKPSSPDFGIGEAVKDWEETVDITPMVQGLIPTPATVRLRALMSPLAAVGRYTPGEYSLANYEEEVDENFKIV